MNRYDGRVVVVTGAARGIGAGTAKRFADEGAHVAILDLDHCGIADPAYDVGNFVASLRQHGIRTSPAGARAAEAPASTFVSAYTDRARPAAQEAFLARVDFYVGVALVRKALRAFARHPLSEEPLRYVEEAHRGLDTRWGSDHANG